MTTFVTTRDSAQLQVFDSGSGLPVVFQHGLGGDLAQVAATFPDGPSLRRITMECRAHGGSTPGSMRPFRIATFADDLLAVCDQLGLDRFVLGGISMGAALSLHLAVRHRQRLRGLILARPAWAFTPAPANMAPFAEVAACLATLPAAQAHDAFFASPTAARLASEAPDNLASLLRFFERPSPDILTTLLADIAGDGPDVDREAARVLDLPTLVIGHGEDFVHPLGLAQDLAAALPRAHLAQIAPKASAPERHVHEFRTAVRDFLDTLDP